MSAKRLKAVLRPTSTLTQSNVKPIDDTGSFFSFQDGSPHGHSSYDGF